MKKFLLMTFLIFAVSFQISYAKQELIEASGNYIMDLKADETFATATARAREEAKRAATEKAGVYLQAYSKTVNLELDYDEVQTVAASLLKIQDEKVDSKSLDNGLLEVIVTIKALVEEQDEETLKNIMSDEQRIKDATDRYKKLQAEYDELKNQMEQLKQNYRAADDSQKAEIKKSIAQNNKYFEAFLALEEGNNAYFSTNYQQAISDYSRAININPNFAEAYNNRGNANVMTKNFQQATQDYQNALRLNRVDARIYNNLGSVYYMLKDYNSAVREYTNSINLNPNFETAYVNRAYAYYYLEQFQNALSDSKIVLKLNPANEDAKKLYNYLIKKVQ